MTDVLIIGGGVIGLTTAYELAGRGVAVRLVEQGCIGGEASWAGAGMLPPADPAKAPPERMLRAVSHLCWPELSARLREETGIDNGFTRCGGLLVGYEGVAMTDELVAHGVVVERLDRTGLRELEPGVNADRGLHLPDMGQIRNPRHLKALYAACLERGVVVHEGEPVTDFDTDGERVTAVRTPLDTYGAGRFCVAGGAWSRSLLSRVGVELSVEPVRGQIVLLRTPRPVIDRILEYGPRYLVPRADGRLIVGSTEEWVGFDKRNTVDGVSELLGLAAHLVPVLEDAEIERTWSGLRPGSRDLLPYLDRVTGFENLFVAAGHFREGLQTSPATGRLITELMLDEPPSIDPTPFRIARTRVDVTTARSV